jgi:putative transposase
MLHTRIKEIAAARVHYGYQRGMSCYREGFKDNHKRVYCLYRQEGLPLRLKRPKRNKSARLRQPKQHVTGNQSDLEHEFCCGCTVRWQALARAQGGGQLHQRGLAIEVGQNLKGEDVVNTLNRIASHVDYRPSLRWIMAANSSPRRGQVGV